MFGGWAEAVGEGARPTVGRSELAERFVLLRDDARLEEEEKKKTVRVERSVWAETLPYSGP